MSDASGTVTAFQAKSGDSGAAVRRRLVAESGGLYRNDAVSDELDGIGKRLSAAAGAAPVTVLVLNSDTPNAYFLPGGYIFLTRNLLDMTNDQSELAAVIAHEMAHILSDHAGERAELRAQTALSSDEIAAALANSERMQALLMQGKSRVAALSRRQELEADAVAVRLLAQAGYDPSAVGRFLKTMYVSAQEAGVKGYAASHPLPSVRIEQAERLARAYPSAAGDVAGK